MSNASDGNLHVFYRYTVPGAVIVFAVLLALPYAVVQKSWSENNAVLITIVIGNIIIAGWALYHAIYPILTQVLSWIKLYPRPNFMKDVSAAIKDSGKDVKANHAWSYFLWSYAPSGIKERVKMLADYGHSLYLVASTFFIFPFFHLIAQAVGSETLFRYVTNTLFHSLDDFTAQVLLFVVSFAISAALLYNGRRRILQAYGVQDLLLTEKRSEFKEFIKKFKQ